MASCSHEGGRSLWHAKAALSVPFSRQHHRHGAEVAVGGLGAGRLHGLSQPRGGLLWLAKVAVSVPRPRQHHLHGAEVAVSPP